jgi:hypothetical protein
MSRKLLLSLLLSATAALPLHQTLAAGSEVKIDVVREDVDFTRYNKFLIQPLDVSDTRLVPPPWAEGSDAKPRAWKISEENAAFLQQQYHRAMNAQLQKLGGYALVDEPEGDALAVEIEIISLTPYANKGDKVVTKGSGEMTFRAEVRDSMTRDLLLMFEGDTPVGQDYQENTEFSVDQNVEALFNEWGEFLRLGLDEARRIAPPK